MRYSWSQMQAYQKCGRLHELGYMDGYEKIPSTGNRSRYYGTAFHAGMAEALIMRFKDNAVSLELLLKTAIAAARECLKDMTIQNKIVTGTDGKSYVDQTYYDMMRELEHFIPEILRFYIPKIDFERYYVPSVGEVITVSPETLPCIGCNGAGTVKAGDYDCDKCHGKLNAAKRTCECVKSVECPICHGTGINRAAASKPMVEFYFEFGKFNGRIDAVLVDRQTGEYILVDWKLRKSFPYDEMAAIDGQLPFYAAMLKRMGATISETVMWQFKLQTPKPAVLTKKDIPSIAAQDTTWEHWLATLPAPVLKRLDLEDWREKLAGKLKDEQDYSRPIRTIVTDFMLDGAYENALEVVHMIEVSQARYLEGKPAMAVLGSMACQFCDFRMLCNSVLKYGGDARDLLELHYQKRTHEGVPEENEE